MKLLFVCPLFVILFSACLSPASKPEAEIDKGEYIFGVESGSVEIVYDQEGSKDILYFDHWGCRQTRYHYASHIEGQPAKLRTIDFEKDYTTVTVDLSDSSSSTSTIPFVKKTGQSPGDVFGYQKERQLRLIDG